MDVFTTQTHTHSQILYTHTHTHTHTHRVTCKFYNPNDLFHKTAGERLTYCGIVWVEMHRAWGRNDVNLLNISHGGAVIYMQLLKHIKCHVYTSFSQLAYSLTSFISWFHERKKCMYTILVQKCLLDFQIQHRQKKTSAHLPPMSSLVL